MASKPSRYWLDRQAVRDDRADVETALNEGDHLVPGLEHLAAVDALQRQHLEDDLVPVDVEKSVGGMPRMAILPPLFMAVDHVAEGRRRAGHFQPDVEALVHADARHHLAAASRCATSTTYSTPSLLGEIEPQRVDVGDHHLARAGALRHQRAHDADRTGAGDQHVLADAGRRKARCAPHCRTDRRSRRSRPEHRPGSARRCDSGMQTYSANEPGRLTPTPSVLRQRWPRPARQLRHLPQTMWPSPDTRIAEL